MKKEYNIWADYLIKGEQRAEYPECTMYELLEKTANRIPNEIALVFEGNKITYKYLMQMIEKTTKALNQYKIK